MKGLLQKNRITNYLWLATIISIIVLLLGLFYYLESAKKERYFDQLYFRQLEEISRGFETNLVRLSSFTHFTQIFISDNFDEKHHNLVRDIEKLDDRIRLLQGESTVDDNTSGETGNKRVSIPPHLATLFKMQTELSEKYSAALSKKEFVNRAKDEVINLYSELREDIEFAMVLGLAESLECHKYKPAEESITAEQYEQYCTALETILDVRKKVPDYTGRDLEVIRKKEEDILIEELIRSLQSINPPSDSYSRRSRVDEIKRSGEVIEFLSNIYEPKDSEDEQHLSFCDYRTEYLDLTGEFYNAGFKVSLDDFYNDAQCATDCDSKPPSSPCDNLPGEVGSEIYLAEVEHQEKVRDTLLAELIVYHSVSQIEQIIPTILSDLKNFTVAAENYRNEVARSGIPSLTNPRLEKLIREQDRELRKLHEIIEGKRRYLKELGPLEDSVRRHDLGLRYGKGKCGIGDEINQEAWNCVGGVFIRASKQSPYPVSNLVVTTYLPDERSFSAPMENLLPKQMDQFSTVLIAAEDGSVIIQNEALTNPARQHFLGIQDLLEKALKDAEESQSDKKCEAGDVDCENESDYRVLKHSAYIDEVVGGIYYRLYIRPHSVGHLNIYTADQPKQSITRTSDPEPQHTLYFIGIKPLKELRASKFKISPGGSLVLFAIVVAILLVFVFLKIYLAHADASFTRSDGLITVYAVVLFVTISTIGLAALGLWDRLHSELETVANETIDIIQNRFENEIHSYFKYVDKLMKNKEVKQALVEIGHPVDSAVSSDYVTASVQQRVMMDLPEDTQLPSIFAKLLVLSIERDMLRFEPLHPIPNGERSEGEFVYISSDRNAPLVGSFDQNPVSPVENIFMLDTNGRLTGRLIRGTRNLRSYAPRDLSARKYFKGAHQGDVWNIHVNCDDNTSLSVCATEMGTGGILPVYVERIFNIVDGARNTQFAIPTRHKIAQEKVSGNAPIVFDAKETYGYYSNKPRVLSFGVSLQTFKAPILPRGLQFAVVENSTGQVLYHSDDDRSLIENFFQETENDPQLQAIIRVSEGTDRNDYNISNRISSFNGVYRGADTVFITRRLHKDVPWTLVVFKPAEEEQLLVTLLFSMSIVIALVVILTTSLVLFFLSLKYKNMFAWLWPQMKTSIAYKKIALQSLLLACPIYLIILFADNLLLLIALATISIIAVVMINSQAVNRYRVQKDTGTPDLSRHRKRYIFMMIAVLLTVVAVPSLAIVEKISGELLHRAGMYNIIKLNEEKREAQAVLDSRLARLCGGMANQRSEYDCASIHYTLLAGLMHYIHTLDSASCHASNDFVFCLTNSEENTEDPHNKPGISPLLEWLDPVWDLPALLVTLQNADDLTITINGEPPYHVIHSQPMLGNMLLSSYRVVLILALTWLVVYGAIRFLAVNLLGINIPRGYRAKFRTLNSSSWDEFVAGNLPEQIDAKASYGEIATELRKETPYYGMIIRPIKRNLKSFLNQDGVQDISERLSFIIVDTLKCTSDPSYSEQVSHLLANDTENKSVLVLENIESIAFDKKKRKLLLNLLEAQMSAATPRSILLCCDVAPLYMLTQQAEYLPLAMREEYTDTQEVVRWSRLLFRYRKHYDWSPMELEFNDSDPWQNLVHRELSAWPELYPLKPELDTLEDQGKSTECAVQYITTHAGPIYRRRWSFCTKKEKLLLYQLAKGLLINPKNIEPLEHMIRRGFIRRDPRWSIVNSSFARFVLTAENESVYNEWVTASEQGLWRIIRIPLFTAVLVIVGILMYSAQEATESFLALATSALALLPLLIRSLDQARASPAGEGENERSQ